MQRRRRRREEETNDCPMDLEVPVEVKTEKRGGGGEE